ncbi:MAG: TonB-dependent receptor [Muribaculaceae bacterium]|jgi:TonB-linked SusC/RagA family outer membrane protein|nr:TonB-dependent receptor [Muribaculaceae bacterium]
MENVKKLFRCISVLTLMMVCGAFTAYAATVSGTVVDDTGEPLIGVSVTLKGNNAGVTTDIDGNYTIQVPDAKTATLTFSYVGMESQEIKINGRSKVDVTLKPNSNALEEVVVVGYGHQKKASVVGAITQTSGAVLERAAGIHDIGNALTGNMPGVVTTQSSGMPGDEEPQITIRGASSWNNSSPLVLVDGIERPMSSVDISSVESISALKDASATAVYGVKGANGVILITTKRGQEGKAKIDVGFTSTMKTISKLPDKYDSYDAMLLHNRVIEHELALSPTSWSYIVPMDRVNKYRYRTSIEDIERYPNVDWRNELFKDAAMSYNAYVNIAGGTKFVRYYTAVDFVSEGDLFRSFDAGRGFRSGFDYNRLNVRSNLDFSITKTTTFKVNVAGSNGSRKTPYNGSGFYSVDWSAAQIWGSVYSTAPDIFMPRYSDGSLGFYPLNAAQTTNSVANIMTAGTMRMTNTRINTDFVLEQDLSMITKGLNFRGMISWDNLFVEGKRGIEDTSAYVFKYIDPATGEVTNRNDYDQTTGFDYRTQSNLALRAGEVANWKTQRHVNYQLQLNWAREFGKHSVSATGVWSRQEDAYGSEIPRYREDWVFRTTYDFDGRYLVEYNGAYNGSEKFGKGYRFGFFNSGAIGWRISGEPFFKPLLPYINNLKLRASYGEIGDDSGDRWLYTDTWGFGGNAIVDGSAKPGNTSPYSFYYQSTIGNPDAHWEKVTKFNFGIDYGFLNDMFAGAVEIFKDKRKDILIRGTDRSIPSYFGGNPPTANLGRAEASGFEVELRFNYPINRDMRTWANFSMTHASNKIIDRDDPRLRPDYQKQAGYAIGQYHSHIDAGFLNNYDMIYGAPAFETNDDQRLPGDYYIVDFNGDGVVNADDSAPYGYTETPQNTYNATLGFEWKGLSVFAQFYGVTGVSRTVDLRSFENQMNNAYDLHRDWWSADGSGDMLVPRWLSTPYSAQYGTQWIYDASYIRLKNVEVAYTWNSGWIKKLGLSNLKVYLNGNNLWLWTRMPDDRESNYGYAASAYPTTRRFNLGVKFSL